MTEVRMSLADAADHLGIAPNSVRSRFKAGKIRGERDNSGKIWVWINPALKTSNPATSKPSIEGSKSFEIEALQAHIQTLSEQLSQANAELTSLRPAAVEAASLKTLVSALEAQLSTLTDDRDQWRQTTQTLLARRSGLWGLFGRR